MPRFGAVGVAGHFTRGDVRERVSDAAAQAAVDLMTDHFANGELARGLIAGIDSIADTAGPGEESGEELPDLLHG